MGETFLNLLHSCEPFEVQEEPQGPDAGPGQLCPEPNPSQAPSFHAPISVIALLSIAVACLWK